jgi:DnaJ-class molecular chaperone
MKTCPDCDGDGVVEKGTEAEQRCPTCGGSGFVPDDDDSHEEVIKTCMHHQILTAEHLAQAERHVQQGEVHVARQRVLVSYLKLKDTTPV